MKYSAREYEVLFDRETSTGTSVREGVSLYRTKTIKAGQIAEIEIYPIWQTQRQAQEAFQQREKQREAQERLNERNAQKKLIRKMNANFGAGDILITNTYGDGRPESDEAAQRDMRNFMRRVKAYRRRLGLTETKYIYITERTEGKNGVRYHHHAIISGDGTDRDAIEGLWPYGHSNARRYQHTDSALTGWACYMTKKKDTQSKAMRRRWCASKNLIEPVVTTADHKISRRKAERIASQITEEARAVFETAYPEYRLTEAPVVKWSDYCAGVYIYARMVKRKGVAE